LIVPNFLQDFSDYNQFLDWCDRLLEQKVGVFQIASFHPEYQFADTEINDVENYTNRSPYPILHILREASVEEAIANYPNAEDIPAKNIKRLQSF